LSLLLSVLFYQSTIIPTLVENSKFLQTSLLPCLQIIILYGEPTQTTSKGSNGVARPSNNHLKVKYPLRISVSYVQATTQQNESKTVQKAPL